MLGRNRLWRIPYIGVVWEDPLLPDGDPPDEYIAACMEAYERFDTPEELYDLWRARFGIQDGIEKLWASIVKLRTSRRRLPQE